MSYAIALFLLVLNDHVLKSAFPGFVTGKLSDFAGVFAFAAFFASAMPRRAAAICVATGALFIWWKSPLSQAVVNALGVSRVVDWTDLAALIVLPFAYRMAVRKPIEWRPSIVWVSLFAFAATSPAQRSVRLAHNDALNHYQTRMAIDEVVRSLVQCGVDAIAHPEETTLEIKYGSGMLNKNIMVIASYKTEPHGVVIDVNLISVIHPPVRVDERAVRDELEQKLETCLRK